MDRDMVEMLKSIGITMGDSETNQFETTKAKTINALKEVIKCHVKCIEVIENAKNPLEIVLAMTMMKSEMDKATRDL